MKPVLDARYVRTAGDNDPLIASLSLDGVDVAADAVVVMRFKGNHEITGTSLGNGDFSFSASGIPAGDNLKFWIDATHGGITITYVHGHIITLGGA